MYTRVMDDHNDLPPQIPVTDEMHAEIHGALAEIDLAQMAVISRMTPAQRMEIGFRMSNIARRVAVDRLRQIHPELGEADANRMLLARYFALEEEYRAKTSS
jgi:hypothetical protein